jgi:hypothetical protein
MTTCDQLGLTPAIGILAENVSAPLVLTRDVHTRRPRSRRRPLLTRLGAPEPVQHEFTVKVRWVGAERVTGGLRGQIVNVRSNRLQAGTVRRRSRGSTSQLRCSTMNRRYRRNNGSARAHQLCVDRACTPNAGSPYAAGRSAPQAQPRFGPVRSTAAATTVPVQ